MTTNNDCDSQILSSDDIRTYEQDLFILRNPYTINLINFSHILRKKIEEVQDEFKKKQFEELLSRVIDEITYSQDLSELGVKNLGGRKLNIDEILNKNIH